MARMVTLINPQTNEELTVPYEDAIAGGAEIPETKGWKGVGQDILGLPGKAYEALNKGAQALPYELEGIAANPQRIPQNLLAGVGEIGRGTANLIPNIQDYFGRKEIIDPNGRRFPRQPEFNMAEAFGLKGQLPGDALTQLIPQLAPFGPSAASGAARGVQATGKGASLAKNAALQTNLGKNVNSKVNDILEGVKNYQERGTKLNEIEKFEEAIKNNLLKEKQALPEGMIATAGKANEALGKELTEKQKLMESLNPYVEVAEAEKTTPLIDKINEAFYEKINPNLSNEYRSFYKSEAGQSKIKAPLSYSEYRSEYAVPKRDLSPTTKELITKSIGEPGFDVIQGATTFNKSPTVEEYSTLWKQTRDEARNLRKQAQNPDLPKGDKERLIGKAGKLDNFSKEVNKKIIESLSPEDARHYDLIQDLYKNMKVPFMEKPLLEKAIQPFPEITVKNFHKKLNEHNIPIVKEYLLEEVPGFKEALAKHDLQRLDITNPKSIRKVMESDQGRDLPKNVQKDMRHLVETLESEKEIRSLLSRIQAGEIGRHVHSETIEKVLNKHPELAEAYKTDAERLAKIRQFENELEKLGLTKQQIKNESSKFEKGIRWAGRGLRLLF